MLARERVADGVWRLPLPSRTLPPYSHTNSYLVRCGPAGVLIDMGSDDPQVLASLGSTLTLLGVTELTALLLTHTHPDHCAGAAAIQESYRVPVYAHPLEHPRLTPDTQLSMRPLQDGDTVQVGTATTQLRVHHTPGHSPGHLSFSLLAARTVLVGDLLAAQGSTWVGHPEGDVADYLTSLGGLAQLDAAVFGPGHGPLVREPKARLGEVRAHQLAREAEVVAALHLPLDLSALRKTIYPDVPKALASFTEGSLRAHLAKLIREGRVVQRGDRYRRAR